LGAQQVGVMSRGQQFLVLEIRTDGGWLFIQYRGGKGWMAASNTTLAGGAALDTSAPATKEAVAIVNTGALNIRTGPGNGFASIGSVNGGTTMRIIGRNRAGDWLQVESPFGEGWVNVTFVTTRNYFGSAPIVDVQPGDAERAPAVFRALTGRINVRSGPNVSFPSQFTIDAGQNFPILGQSKDRQWWLIETQFGEGWVLKQLGQSSGDIANVPVVE
jgi:N-acetylmuramoyl-L-alanine amidase